MSNKNYVGSILISPEELPKALQEVLTDFLHSSFEVRQKALQAGAETFKTAIENATPKDTGEMAKSWKIKTKYKDKRYIGNTKTTTVRRKNKMRSGVPLSNVLEYAENSPHQGFIRRCYDENESQIFETIKNTIKNGGK